MTAAKTHHYRPSVEKIPLLEKEKAPEYTPPTKGVLSVLPASWVPYAELIRFDKPFGTFITQISQVMGLLYASSLLPASDLPLSLIASRTAQFGLWAFFMRSGVGCCWNDIVDRDLDALTPRCRNRPMARKAISLPSALTFLAVLTSLAFAAVWSMGTECVLVGAAMLTLSFIYPLGKRFTDFPQLILGSTFGMGIILGAYSVPGFVRTNKKEELMVATWCLAGALALLIAFNDVVYARADIADDIKSGVRGMAVKFRHHLGTLLGVMASSVVGLLVVVGREAGLGWCYYVFAVGGTAVNLGMVVGVVQRHEEVKVLPRVCFAATLLSINGGFVVEALLERRV
ncbi:Prenytransferase ascA [Podospora australis]|uniref:Prenytransferase ascA n=1 Tax=Podospora australis TaxID=1536484 RepID=A0AAN6WME1_9PEZI|nr:Prenytransferase ascA [Podospora australis]